MLEVDGLLLEDRMFIIFNENILLKGVYFLINFL